MQTQQVLIDINDITFAEANYKIGSYLSSMFKEAYDINVKEPNTIMGKWIQS